MRLVSFGPAGEERPALLAPQGLVPVSALDPAAPSSACALLADGGLARLAPRLAAWPGPWTDPAGVRLGPPVPDAGAILCVGRNYVDHASEQNQAPPTQPMLFAKTRNALAGPHDAIRHPSDPGCFLDYEVELALVIGRRARAVPRDQAFVHLAGVMVANDVTARRWQKADGQWYRGKSCDTFLPCGPALVTLDEVGDLGALVLTTDVDGERRQEAPASDLIFDVPTLIEYITRDITLEPGDIICTGTPAGVGAYRKPPVALAAGNVVECAIAGVGALRNRVVEGR